MKKDIRMISGCEDKQTSADVSDVNRYVKKILICLYMPVGRKEKKTVELSKRFRSYLIQYCVWILRSV